MPDRVPAPVDWEAFYHGYRKPGYVPGFEILHRIGSGSFGIVFKARKESIAKDYAIKFLKVDDDDARQAILSEIEGVRHFAQVDHPNLVSIEDRGEVDGIPYIVMGFAGDTTLRQELDGRRLSREEALGTFVQVARGLKELHDHSLVHFDVKPANVFLRGDHVRLGDYGLSKLVAQSRNSLSFGRGTPYYMAPELLQRRGDARSDIYALGCLLHECLTGEVPFRGSSEWEVLRQHEHAVLQLPTAIAEPERGIVERCLQKRPEDRFGSVDEILDRIEAAAAPVAPLEPATRSRASVHAADGTATIGAAPPARSPGAAPALSVLAMVCAALVVLGMMLSARAPVGPQHTHAVWRASARPTQHQHTHTESVVRSSLRRHVTRATEAVLRRIARGVAESDADAILKESLHDAARDVRRELRRMDLPALERALDGLEGSLEESIDEIDGRLRALGGEREN